MDEWIAEGTHITCIGADAPGKEELDPAILKRAKIVVDDWEQASHSGEINVPIAKQHGSTRLTLGMKNLMGLVRNRNTMHTIGLHQSIADLASLFRPELTVVDAVRILTANGPTGGNLSDVVKLDTVVVSPDMVAADAYATRFFGLTPQDIRYIKYGADLGLGRIDVENLNIEEVQL
jgi:uncharacterized protein (DUF362 family)